jgi:hypothetical protein
MERPYKSAKMTYLLETALARRLISADDFDLELASVIQ